MRASRELCELLWEAMHEELRNPREERIRELSERLSQVALTVAMLTEAPHGGPSADERRTPPKPVSSSEPEERVTHLSPVPGAANDSLARMRLVDEQESQPPAQPPSGAPSAHASSAPAQSAPAQSAHAHAQTPQAPSALPQSVRREEGASAWINTVGRLLDRHTLDGLPFAVLLVEVVDVAHIERSESPAQVNNLIAQVEHALGRALRAEDTLSRESFGRYWLVAPETNGTGARMLAERLARLVRTSASHRGVPLEVAIGIAVCPEDGTDAPALAARADLGVYSARANGRPVSRTEPPA